MDEFLENRSMKVIFLIHTLMFIILLLNLIVSNISVLLLFVLLIIEIFTITFTVFQNRKKFFYFLWNFEVFFFISALFFFNYKETFGVPRETIPAIVIFGLLVFVEVLISLVILFDERIIKKILIVLTMSSAFIVVLIVSFVAVEGSQTFEETPISEFLFSSKWMSFYEEGATLNYSLVVEPKENEYSILVLEPKIFGEPDIITYSSFFIINEGANTLSFTINTSLGQENLQIDETSIAVAGNSRKKVNLSLFSEDQGIFPIEVSLDLDDSDYDQKIDFEYVVENVGVKISPNFVETIQIAEAQQNVDMPFVITNKAQRNATYKIELNIVSERMGTFFKGDNLTWDFANSTGVITVLSNSSDIIYLRPNPLTYLYNIHEMNIFIYDVENESICTNAQIIYTLHESDGFMIDSHIKSISSDDPAIFFADINVGEGSTMKIISPSSIKVKIFSNGNLLGDSDDEPINLDSIEDVIIQAESLSEISNSGEHLIISVKLPEVGTPSFGIASFIAGTFITVIFSVLIAIPLGLGCAIFLAEYCPKKIRKILRPLFELLAGIPSILYGIWGAFTIAPIFVTTITPFLSNSLGSFIPFFAMNTTDGRDFFTASIILSIMILPIILTLSEDAIRAVPKGLKEGSLAMGATRWETVRKILIPKAKSGIFSAVILSVGRAIGETMAVLMVMSFATTFPTGIFSYGATMTTVIAKLMDVSSSLPKSRQALFAVALTLFFMIFILNIILFTIKGRSEKAQKKTSKPLLSLLTRSIFIAQNPSKKRFVVVEEKDELKEKKKKFMIVPEDGIKKQEQEWQKSTLVNSKKNVPSKKIQTSSCQTNTNKFISKLKKDERKKRRKIDFDLSMGVFSGPKWKQASKAVRKERIMVSLLIMGALVVSMVLFWIISDVVIKGIVGFNLSYFYTVEIGSGGAGGFLNAITGSLALVGFSIGIAFPLALGSAIYIQEYAKKENIFTRVILFASDTLASTPSIVYGAFGLVLFVKYIGFGVSFLAGGLTLACMALPILLRSCIEAIKAIPFDFQEGSFALGASKWQTIVKTVIPPAMVMISSGVIIAMGRVIGETAAVMFSAGYLSQVSTRLLYPIASLPIMIWRYFQYGVGNEVVASKLYSASLVLIIVVLALNGISRLVGWRFGRMMKN